ncbi:hypothetical protein JXA34_03645 [Patescibacteria group bacterium]|nr:hypothetical protein [Patescibacteria group bacterium]
MGVNCFIKKNISIIINVFLVIISTILLFCPPTDPDFGWQYKYGEYIVTNRDIPKKNFFSYPNAGEPWADFYWVSQIILYALYSNLPSILAGLILSVVFSIVFIKLLDTYGTSYTGRILSVFLIPAYLSRYILIARPMFFSSIFTMLLVYIFLKKPNFQHITPIIFLIWANMHADWIFGMIITGFFYLFRYLEQKNKGVIDIILLLKTILALALNLCATLINPYRLFLWVTLGREAIMANRGFIAEWSPINIGTDISSIFYYLAFMITAGTILAATFFYKKILPKWYLVSIIFLFILACKSGYFFRLFILVSLPALPNFLGVFSGNVYTNIATFLKNKGLQKIFRVLGILLIMTLSLISLENFTFNIASALNTKYWSIEARYPFNAVNTIKNDSSSRFKGNMLNSYNWGGYLIWQLPEHKTFIDGRLPAWCKGNKPELILEYRAASKDFEKLKSLIQEYNISWILLDTESQMGELLLDHESNFEIIEKDDIYVLALPKED